MQFACRSVSNVADHFESSCIERMALERSLSQLSIGALYSWFGHVRVTNSFERQTLRTVETQKKTNSLSLNTVQWTVSRFRHASNTLLVAKRHCKQQAATKTNHIFVFGSFGYKNCHWVRSRRRFRFTCLHHSTTCETSMPGKKRKRLTAKLFRVTCRSTRDRNSTVFGFFA